MAAERKGKATGRIRLKHIRSRESKEIQGFITEAISHGATIISDRHKSYPSIVKKGYLHAPQNKPYFWEEVDGDDDRLIAKGT